MNLTFYLSKKTKLLYFKLVQNFKKIAHNKTRITQLKLTLNRPYKALIWVNFKNNTSTSFSIFKSKKNSNINLEFYT